MSTGDFRRNDVQLEDLGVGFKATSWDALGRAIQLAEADVNIVDSRTKLRGSRKNPPKSEIGTFHQPIGIHQGAVGEVYGESFRMG
jgi:hypothetical protein